MTQQSIQAEIDAENERQSRIDRLMDTSLPHQLKRLEDVRRIAEISIGQVFGHRLAPIVTNRILDGLILESEVLAHIGSATMRELPADDDRKGWASYVTRLVEKEPVAALSINSSDAKLNETLRQNFLAQIRPSDRLSLSRSGKLDEVLAAKIKEELQKRSGIFND